MILNVTTEEAEVLYRVLGGKKGVPLGEDVLDAGIGLGIGEKNPGVADPFAGAILSPADEFLKQSVLIKVTLKRQQEDARALVKLDKLVDDLEASGFNEDTIADLRRAQVDSLVHNNTKYSDEFRDIASKGKQK